MSPDQDPTLTLFTLHGLAVSLRDRADTHTERAEALLLGVERAFTQQMAGEPIVLGIHPKQPSYAFPARLSAPCGAGLCPLGAQQGNPYSNRHFHALLPEVVTNPFLSAPAARRPIARTPPVARAAPRRGEAGRRSQRRSSTR